MHLRTKLPGLIFPVLPVTLFFPIGVMYVAIVFYFVTWFASGDLREKWMNISQYPIFKANLLFIVVVLLSAVFLSAGNEHRWSGILHYLVFMFLLFFAAGADDIAYHRAKLGLFIGTLYAGLVFCCAKAEFLPDWVIFSYYQQYAGNKSISIGVFMAIAAAWMLNEAFDAAEGRTVLKYLAGYAFTEWAVVQFSVTRTGTLLVYLLSALVILYRFQFNRRYLAITSVVFIVMIGVVVSNGPGNRRLQEIAPVMKVLQEGEAGSGESARLQFLRVTGQMIAEKPILGYGIGGWRHEYPIRAQGLETALMSTPHNDYLLYGAELGLIGPTLLVWIFGILVREALRANSTKGTALLLVMVALTVSSMFNAMLRDWRFGVPLMLMIAIAHRNSVTLSSPHKTDDRCV
jgi:O-antigen ligase